MSGKRRPAPPEEKTGADPLEEKDFYFEGSRMVFTERFLRERGFCCQCGCRHCPYGFGPEGYKRKQAAEQQGR